MIENEAQTSFSANTSAITRDIQSDLETLHTLLIDYSTAQGAIKTNTDLSSVGQKQRLDELRGGYLARAEGIAQKVFGGIVPSPIPQTNGSISGFGKTLNPDGKLWKALDRIDNALVKERARLENDYAGQVGAQFSFYEVRAKNLIKTARNGDELLQAYHAAPEALKSVVQLIAPSSNFVTPQSYGAALGVIEADRKRREVSPLIEELTESRKATARLGSQVIQLVKTNASNAFFGVLGDVAQQSYLSQLPRYVRHNQVEGTMIRLHSKLFGGGFIEGEA